MKKTDVYEIVKQNLIQRIEEISNGQTDGTWQKPWSLQPCRPINWLSSRAYRGVNLFLLNGCGTEFLTMNQIRELQASQKYKDVRLREGSKSHLVIYFKMVEHHKDESEEETLIPVLRYYRVFSLDDLDGLELRRTPSSYEHTPDEAEQALNAALTKYFEKAGIPVRTTKSDGCYYSPSHHSITIPDAKYFEKFNWHLSSLAHEAVHSTGKQMGRTLNCDQSSQDYAHEELIAELGAAILLAVFQVCNECSEANSAAYLHGWMTRIEETPARKLLGAFSAAQKAVDYILGEEI
ncbi:MAG: DUF1738 domain-containing protein [Bacteroidaceae bacterium]|nr:DUF1738 domain-containing protein [Bacteroidaceae bacterium]